MKDHPSFETTCSGTLPLNIFPFKTTPGQEQTQASVSASADVDGEEAFWQPEQQAVNGSLHAQRQRFHI